jgi:hypothetical protein
MEEMEGRVEGREGECPCLGSLCCGVTGRVGDRDNDIRSQRKLLMPTDSRLIQTRRNKQKNVTETINSKNSISEIMKIKLQ